MDAGSVLLVGTNILVIKDNVIQEKPCLWRKLGHMNGKCVEPMVLEGREYHHLNNNGESSGQERMGVGKIAKFDGVGTERQTNLRREGW